MIHMRTLSFKITFAGFSFLMGRSVFRFRLYSFHSLCERAVARSLRCKAHIVYTRAIAKSGFCKFIGNFLDPVSPISFGEFF